MFDNNDDRVSSTDFVRLKQQERLERMQAKKKSLAAVKIQAVVRMFICKKKVSSQLRTEFDSLLHIKKSKTGITAMALFSNARKLLFIYKEKTDEKRFQCLCEAIITNLESGKEPKYWYMSVMLIKDFTTLWVSSLKKILYICFTLLKSPTAAVNSGKNGTSLYLAMLVTFTDSSSWKILKIKGGENIAPIMHQLCNSLITDLISRGMIMCLEEFLMNGLCRASISLNGTIISATNTLFFRSFKTLSESVPTMHFIVHVLSIPAYIYHLNQLAPESGGILKEIFPKTIEYLYNYENLKQIYTKLDVNRSLCVVGNLVYLFHLNTEQFQKLKFQLKVVLIGLLKNIQLCVGKQSGNSKWNPIFGWYNEVSTSCSLNEAYVHIIKQIKVLWHHQLIKCFFENLPSSTESEGLVVQESENQSKGRLLRRAFMKTFKKPSETLDLNEPIVMDICTSCDLYRTLTVSLIQLKMEIVAALSLQEEVLVRLWKFVYSLGPGAGLKSILNYIMGNSVTLPAPLSSLLVLFFECSLQLLPILDDSELYEKQKPFSLDDLVKLSAFLNSMVFKMIWLSSATTSNQEILGGDVKKAALQLLLLIHDRDCRKQFTPNNHWLVKELKVSQFHFELMEKVPRALAVLKDIPHVIPHMERMKIFYNWISEDKKSLGIDKECSHPSALISINRSHLLENGYEQLCRYTGTQLKGIIRVKFVNEHGLDEVGIDQDGVFKEFLEDVITEAFNPELNLFKMTCGEEQRLYPSPTSFLHENHLQLFEFVGKMLGKALYEGILVDVPFASFFLNYMLQHKHSPMYSSIDELPSLDPEMYKNLNFIKTYNGDVSDLELVFAFDEDVLGQMVTHDLKPGGRFVSVTNSNKMTYIHLMARYRLHTQIKQQSAAFVQGFLSIISPEWLRIFSAPQLQRLISGDTENFDLADLKNYTRYYGGYHASHQTIVWLWDILSNDFTLQEKKLFLKFVTSCSNPPLLGFKHLEPPFSIRFVDSSDEDDNGDTPTSIVRGLFSLRKRGTTSSARLPTSSTCFNLLKLPCYKKKSILKEKLKYAIKSGAGFELS
ncbi:ubiquitin-protein ligase E3B isoform X1 [Hydra vulgaris]|uniref:ubiquitin-protein ligase E3B isoform X1 n=1 Tax=Hydra vulgaris TaxID=6087 RepID=UPI001F5EA90B|nr:ubiquitin-protein ligase E3B isoform X1 [Hydra vulgaris]